MPNLQIRFPARRYHATPWGHHVNEGLIEWPPSPWRVLRALLAVGYTTGMWDGTGPPEPGRSLIEKLAASLPLYHLPRAAGAHSRHYMPVGKLKKGIENTTLVFDTWAQVDEGAITIIWDSDLNEEETEILSALAERMGYLGRSESWVDARLISSEEPPPAVDKCIPSTDPPPPGWEQIPLLAVQPPAEYAGWRESAVEDALSILTSKMVSKKKPTKKQREKAVEPFPPDLIACLQVETAWLRKYGWSQPPGSRRVFYQRKIDSLEAGAPKPLFARVSAPVVQGMLLSLSTESGNDHALPPVTRTLPQAELFHRALTSHATRNGESCPVITGCDDQGKPLRGAHEHAHVLPLDLDGDGHLEHVLVWAPGGLNGKAQDAIRSVRRTYAKQIAEPLRVALAGAGSLSDLRLLPDEYGRRIRRILGPESGAREWMSLTPFVAPRYLKKSGRNTLEGQVTAELASRGLPAPVEIRLIEPNENPEFLRHRHFVRVRRRGPRPAVDFGYSLRIRFETPVSGPLCLGYAGHFGMGMFTAVSA